MTSAARPAQLETVYFCDFITPDRRKLLLKFALLSSASRSRWRQRFIRAGLHRHYSHLGAKAGLLRNAAALVRPAAKTDAPTGLLDAQQG